MNTRKTLFGSAIVLSAALTLSACATGDSAAPTPEQTAPPAQPAPQAETDSAGPSEQQNSDPATALHPSTEAALAAIVLAEAHAGGVAYELDDEDDETAWQIDVNVGGTEVEVDVNWQGTAVLSSETDDAIDSDDLEKLSQATITISEAIMLASGHASGYVAETDLDSENGVVVWEVEFEDGDEDWEVTVHAQSGDIISVERH